MDNYFHNDVEIKHLTSIGDHTAIDKGFYCTTQLILGDYIHIGPYATVSKLLRTGMKVKVVPKEELFEVKK